MASSCSARRPPPRERAAAQSTSSDAARAVRALSPTQKNGDPPKLASDTATTTTAQPAAVPSPSQSALAALGFEPNGPNQIRVQPGEMLRVADVHPSGWAFGQNMNTRQEGWFPQYVVPRPEDAAAAAAKAAEKAAEAAQAAAAAQAQAQLAAQARAPPSPASSQSQARAPQSPSEPAREEVSMITARANFVAADPSQLNLLLGDTVQVIERHDTGWTYGRKLGDESEGWFPDWLLTLATKDMKPQADRDMRNGDGHRSQVPGAVGLAHARPKPSASTLNANAPVFSPHLSPTYPQGQVNGVSARPEFTPPMRQEASSQLPPFNLATPTQTLPGGYDASSALGFNPHAPAFVPTTLGRETARDPRELPGVKEGLGDGRCACCGVQCSNFFKVMYSTHGCFPLCSPQCWQAFAKDK